MTEKFELKDSGSRREFRTGAVRDRSEGKGRMDLLSPFANMRTARWLEKGASKYGERNWERGMPFSWLLDSALRHLYKYQAGCRDEDHLAAARFNIDALMHFEELNRTDLMDLPLYEKEEQKTETSEKTESPEETENWFQKCLSALRSKE